MALKGRLVKVVVDRDLCSGHAVCEEVAPEVFTVGDDAVAQVKIASPGEEIRSKVEEAVWRCPAAAIQIEES
jgi:ferredoxin